MKWKRLVLVLIANVVAASSILFAVELTFPFAESSLNGLVKSQKGELLEGIVVRAKKQKSSVAYSVISDAQGKYRFPTLDSGTYSVEIARADGLESDAQQTVLRADKESHLDFTLRPARDMEASISAVDWLQNFPGTPEERKLIDGCFGCHTGTPTNFRFDKDGWLKVVRLMRGTMMGFANVRGTPARKLVYGAKPTRDLPDFEETNQKIADLLARTRGPQPLDWSGAKLLARPTGPSTRVLITEYEVPYHKAEPHDLGIDDHGNVWWTDWRWGTLGRLDPSTGEMKYWVVPPLEGKPEEHPGTFQVEFDEDGNPWTTIVWTGGLAKLDLKTEKFTTWMFPDQGPHKIIDIGYDKKRGRFWFNSHDYQGRWGFGYYVPKLNQHTMYHLENGNQNYDFVIDSEGVAYQLKSSKSAVDRVDPDTGVMRRYTTPTPNAFPRRGDHDAKNRIWFAEYNAGQIGMLDPAAGKITEYKLPIPMARPYGLGADHQTGLIWVPEHFADRLAALNPDTGAVLEYLMPTRHVMSRSVKPHPSSRPGHSVVWYGSLPKTSSNDGNGKIVRVDAW